jgi:hypothetical protein
MEHLEMANAGVEERIAALENRVEALQHLLEERLPDGPAKEDGGWRAIIGTFADDPLYEEAMRLGREWRQSRPDAADEGDL